MSKTDLDTLRRLSAPGPDDDFSFFAYMNAISLHNVTEEVKANAVRSKKSVRKKLTQTVIELLGNALDNGADERGALPLNKSDRNQMYRVPVSISMGRSLGRYYVRATNITDQKRGNSIVQRIDQLASMPAAELERRYQKRYLDGAPDRNGYDEYEAGLLGLLMVARMAAAERITGKRLISAKAHPASPGYSALEIMAQVADE